MASKKEVSGIAHQHMAAWFSQRPTFALMGEFSAGKSTLLNVLLGRPVLPAMVTATKLPAIWMTHSSTPSCYGLTHDGQLHPLDGDAPDRDSWDQFLLVRMALDAPVLRLSDIIDTPGISDPRLVTGSLRFLADYIDFGIWCTAANQAWRQSEKAAWSGLPKRLRTDGILAVTRADKLGSANDLHKVVKRLATETGPLFREICAIASLIAMDSAADGKITDTSGWKNSGAHALMQAIKISIAVAETACADRPIQSAPAALALVPATDAAAEPQDQAPKVTPSMDVMQALHDALQKIDNPPTKNNVLATIDHLRDALLGENKVDDAHADVLAKCLSVNGSSDLDYARVLKQVEQDIEDFAEGAWCHLAGR